MGNFNSNRKINYNNSNNKFVLINSSSIITKIDIVKIIV